MFAKIINGTQEKIATEIEQTMIYHRTDGLRASFTVGYVDDGACVGGIALWRQEDLLTLEPPANLDLNREEIRYLRALLNCPEVVAMLEEDVESDDIEQVPLSA